MLDIKFLRENPEVVKQNIRNKFQDQKLELVDKVIELDKENRDIKQEVEALRAKRNKISKQIGALMGQGKREEAEEVKKQVAVDGSRIEALSAREKEVEEEIKKIMMVIPNIIDPSVPIGKDDSENVEAERFGEPVVPDFEIPYHTDIMESMYWTERSREAAKFESAAKETRSSKEIWHPSNVSKTMSKKCAPAMSAVLYLKDSTIFRSSIRSRPISW